EPDLGETDPAGVTPAGVQEEATFHGAEGNGRGGANGGTGHRTRREVHPARAVERENRPASCVHRLDHLAVRRPRRTGRTRAQETVDDHPGGREGRLRRAGDRDPPAVGEVVRHAGAFYGNGDDVASGSGERPQGNDGVTAVVAPADCGYDGTVGE